MALRIPDDLVQAPGDPGVHALYRRGLVIRLHQGVYIPTSRFMELARHERYLRVVAAKVLRCPDTIFAGETALLLAGMPIFGTPQLIAVAAQTHARLGPEKPTASVAAGAPADVARAVAELPRIHRRLRPVAEPYRAGDFWTVPLDMAVASAAAQLPFGRALAAVDGRLRHAVALGLSGDTLDAAVDAERSAPKRDRARLIVSLGNPLAENGHESAGRSIMLQHGFERPELQHRFVDRRGEMYCDYYFPSVDTAAEGDGFGKYLDPTLLRGRTPRQALAAEKDRQARMELLCETVVRWSRDDVALRPSVVLERLRSAGVPSDPRWCVRLA